MSPEQLDIKCSSYRDNCKLFVVGVGASAGGLQALEKFFKNMPSDSGAAFVVVQHLSPNFKSLMKELLERHTQMEIHRVTDGMELAANSIFLIPKDKNIILEGNKLRLVKRESRKNLKPNFPIDLFFNSLAKNCQEKAVGVILSGSGSDGSSGLQTIYDAGGLVLVQEPSTAEFDGMPFSAIAKLNLHNFLDNSEDIIQKGGIQQVNSPEQLAGLTYHFLVSSVSIQQKYINSYLCLKNAELIQITDILLKYNQVNLSSCNNGDLSRCINYRCSATGKNIDEYIEYLQESNEEKQVLSEYILIAVPSFFKDKGAWKFLEYKILPDLIAKSQPDEELKFWVSGCATGEEAYSLAIIIDEALSKLSFKLKVKIFATDINSDALEKATLGVYPLTIANDITPERLEKYFTPQQDSFKVKRKLQKMLIFAHHDLSKDAVFTRINLIVYRNILMSVQPDLQHKILLSLHFALKNKGILFLGNAEYISFLADEFISINNKYKFYSKRRDVNLHIPIPVISVKKLDKYSVSSNSYIDYRKKKPEKREIILEKLLNTFINDNRVTCLLIDKNNQVVEVFEDLANVLKFPVGKLTHDVTHLVSPPLQLPLKTTLHRVRKEKKSVIYGSIKLNEKEKYRTIELKVNFYENSHSMEDLLMVAFQEQYISIPPDSQASEQISQLEHQLEETEASLKNSIEELDLNNEEYDVINENLFAYNEKLHITNEALKLANQELYIVNTEYQLKINELAELNEDVNNLLRHTNIGVVVVDKQLRIRKFTSAATIAINLIEKDINRPLKHLSHNLDCHNFIQIIEEVIETEKSLDLEVKLTNKDKDLLIRINPYIKNNGNLDGVVISFIDISEIKTTQNKLQQTLNALQAANTNLIDSEERFRSFYLKTPVMLHSIDESGRIIEASNFWVDKLGYERQEVIGKKFIKFLTPESRRYLVEVLPEFLDSGSCWNIPYKIVCRNGEVIDTLLNAIADKNHRGDVIRTLVVMIDVTERTQAEATLKETEARFEIMADTAPVLIWMIDNNYQGTFFNQAWWEFTGNNLEQQLGEGWLDNIHTQDRNLFFRDACSWDGVCQPIELQFRIQGVDGQYYWMLGKQAPRFDSQGELIGYIGSCIDITEIKNAQEQLTLNNNQLEQNSTKLSLAKEVAERANQAKNSFIAHMSHELRTPLNGILGFAQILQADKELSDEQHRRIDNIYHSGEHLLRLLNDILNLSKIEANQLELELKEISFPSFIEEIISVIDVRAQQKDITFNYQAFSSLPSTIVGDETRLRQVLLNLLGNAVKFTRKGRVNFQVGQLGDCDVAETQNSQNIQTYKYCLIRFQVKDTGVGIPPEKMEEIFLPFHQLQNDDFVNEGSGLGLTISQRIVNLMGGEIKASSIPGEGTLFYFDLYFPEAENNQFSTDILSTLQPIGIKDKHPKILIVDDNETNRCLLVTFLEELGFEVSEAINGKQGLEKVESFQPDLILVDLVMPVMDGFEITQSLRNNPQFEDMPIIIISANAMFDAQLSSYRIGCNAFLPKPIDLNLLLKSITQLLAIEWIYPQSSNLTLESHKPTNQITTYPNTDSFIVNPSEEYVNHLLHLAQIGDIEAVIEQTEYIQNLDSKYLPFVKKVCELAENFQQHKLIKFLEKCAE